MPTLGELVLRVHRHYVTPLGHLKDGATSVVMRVATRHAPELLSCGCDALEVRLRRGALIGCIVCEVSVWRGDECVAVSGLFDTEELLEGAEIEVDDEHEGDVVWYTDFPKLGYVLADADVAVAMSAAF